ncbi:hypothetical protein KC19_10G078800 [Ceratodon purpureus]|uniref:Uncharacterized protein n=1 Tax=Ceratodon purpureus TaxID=3225 RepID=A0A8T0GLG4_CERPU|nr:hypothetical protein KC19_10G078800 [Ceratodon purpureus]
MTRKVEKEMRPVLAMLGPRPGAEAVEAAKQAVVVIEQRLAVESAVKDLPVGKEKELREAAEREKLPYMAVIQLETLHQSYEELLKQQGSKSPTTKLDAEEASGVAIELEKALAEATAKKVELFDFSGKGMKNVPRSLTAMSFLSSLNLSNNQLEALPSALGCLVNLVVLNVQSNQLKSLPDSIGNLSKLTTLNVSGNMIKALPESLGKCSKLVELNANFNKLENFLPVLGWKLTKLQKLELHFNNLVGLPESFGHLKALKHLDLRNNHLRSLPSSVGMLSQLETLDLSRNFNNLCTLPDSIGDLLSLSVLDLSFNQIRELPASLGCLKNLKKLMLDQNPLVVPPKRVIEHSQEAVLAYLLDIHQNGPKPGHSTTSQTGRKLSPPGRSPAACLMIPASPRHEHAGGWVPVRPGSTWMRSFFGQFVCGGAGNIIGGNTMRWQEYHSDDEDR